MNYNRLVSVTGMSGLFELISSKTDGAVVKSLEDNTSKFISSRIHNFSHLESIEIYTTTDNVNLSVILSAIKESKETLPEPKASDADLRKYFSAVYPTIDLERVYISDMKKIVKWYKIISDKKIEFIPKEEEVIAEEKEEKPKNENTKKEIVAETPTEEKTEVKPKKAAAKKSTTATDEIATETKPKKAPAKKKAE